MKKEYDEIMEKIIVTDEMRSRILNYVQTIGPERPSKALRFPAYKKALSIAACFVVVLAGIFTLPGVLSRQRPVEPPVQTVPDIVKYDSIGELSQAVGFPVTEVDALPFEVLERTYIAYWHEVAQITYTGKDQSAVFRKSIGNEDNSGDFNSWDTVQEVAIDSVKVTLSGHNGSYMLAVWSDNGASYSLKLSSGMAEDSWRNLVTKII